MKLSYFSYTNKGGRPNNEDSLRCQELDGRGVFVLADGLGGHQSGETASAIAVEAILAGASAAPSLDGGTLLHQLAEQAVAGAIGIQNAMALFAKADSSLLLRIELDEFGSAPGDIGHKGDGMGFGHGVLHGEVVVSINDFHLQVMGGLFFRLQNLWFQGRQGNAAAAEAALAQGGNHIAAHRADIELHLFQVAGLVLVGA